MFSKGTKRSCEQFAKHEELAEGQQKHRPICAQLSENIYQGSQRWREVRRHRYPGSADLQLSNLDHNRFKLFLGHIDHELLLVACMPFVSSLLVYVVLCVSSCRLWGMLCILSNAQNILLIPTVVCPSQTWTISNSGLEACHFLLASLPKAERKGERNELNPYQHFPSEQ